MKNWPLVSIAIATFNHKKFISKAISSALAQDYANIEIVISDDCSNDETIEVINQYIKEYPDKIKLTRSKQNIGAAGNWYNCFKACSGKYVLALAGDDELMPSIVQKLVQIMAADPYIAICYCDALVYHVKTQKVLYRLSDKVSPRSGNLKTALRDALYYSPGTMFARELLPNENSFETIRHGADLALLKEIMIKGGAEAKIYYLPEALYKYQKHESNITLTDNSYRKEHIAAIQILQGKYPNYKLDLNPAIYDFCCVAFFKALVKFEFSDAIYFLKNGLKAAKFNPFKFFRALVWGVKFYLKKTL